MRKRHLQLVLLIVLVTGSLVGEAPPALAGRCEGSGGGFERPEYEVTEDGGYVQLQVCDAWGPAWQGQIDYRTSDLTASAGHDYEQASGTMTFLGEGGACFNCVVRIAIVNDRLFESEEQFEVKLTGYRGTFVNRGRESAIVTILDDERSPVSGGSESTSRSIQQNLGSRSGSGVRPSSESSATGTQSGYADAGQAGDTGENITAVVGEPEAEDPTFAGDEVAPLTAKASDPNEPSSSFLPELGILLLMMVLAGTFWAKKNVGRRLT